MKKVRNVLVFALIVVFTFAQLPMSAMAKDVGISQLDDEDFVAQVKEITAFAELAEEVRWQNTNTPQFPDTLESTVEGEVVQIPVTGKLIRLMTPMSLKKVHMSLRLL